MHRTNGVTGRILRALTVSIITREVHSDEFDSGRWQKE
jgi:hypothetical protein